MCLDHTLLLLIRELDPTIPICCDWYDAFKGIFFLYTGLLPHVNIPYDTVLGSFLTREYLGRLIYKIYDSESYEKSTSLAIYTFVQFMFKFPAHSIFNNLNARG